MGVFLFAAIALIGATVLILLRPWRSSDGRADATSTQELNTRLYRDQLAELDRDLATGTLAAADHAQARADLQRRLLEDVAQTEAVDAAPGARRTSLVLAIALPVAAAGLYAFLGSPAALLPQAPAVAGAPTPQQVEQDGRGPGDPAREEPRRPEGLVDPGSLVPCDGPLLPKPRPRSDGSAPSFSAIPCCWPTMPTRWPSAPAAASKASRWNWCRQPCGSIRKTAWRCPSRPLLPTSARITPWRPATGSACCHAFRRSPTKPRWLQNMLASIASRRAGRRAPAAST